MLTCFVSIKNFTAASIFFFFTTLTTTRFFQKKCHYFQCRAQYPDLLLRDHKKSICIFSFLLSNMLPDIIPLIQFPIRGRRNLEANARKISAFLYHYSTHAML